MFNFSADNQNVNIIKMETLIGPVVLFGFCGTQNEKEENLEFYKDEEKIMNSYTYFNQCCESYEEFNSYERNYKKNWSELQLEYLKQLEEIYRIEHNGELNKKFVSSSVTFGILNDKTIVGFLMLAKTMDTMLIVEIFVREEYRGKGIGKKLFDYVLKLYPSFIFTLHVSVFNEIAIGMYLKYNFLIVNTVEKYYEDKGKFPYVGEGTNAYYMLRFPIKTENLLSTLSEKIEL